MQELAAMSQITKEGVKNGNVDKIKWRSKFQGSNIFFRFSKNKKHGALLNSILVGSMFFVL